MVSFPNSVTKFWCLLNLMSFLSHLGNTHTRNAHCSLYSQDTVEWRTHFYNISYLHIVFMVKKIKTYYLLPYQIIGTIWEEECFVCFFFCRPPLSGGKKKIFDFIQFSKRQIWNTKLTLTYSQNWLLKLTCLEVNKTIYFCRLSISSLFWEINSMNFSKTVWFASSRKSVTN